ncbi:MAG: MarR family transcriptional regulator [Planctomycetota bacterium]|nr:MarR family transcriptional regulator [Planctomycetota bacterium]
MPLGNPKENLLDDLSDPRYAAIRDVIIRGRRPKSPLEASMAAFAEFVEERGPKVLANAASELLGMNSTPPVFSRLADALADLQTLAHLKNDLKWVEGRARLFDVSEALLLEGLNGLIQRATDVSACLLVALPGGMLKNAGIGRPSLKRACRDVLSGDRRRRERAKAELDVAIRDIPLIASLGVPTSRKGKASPAPPTGLSRGAYKVYTFLKGQPSASTYDDISVALVMSRGSISKALKELAAQGLISRPHGKNSGVVLKR